MRQLGVRSPESPPVETGTETPFGGYFRTSDLRRNRASLWEVHRVRTESD